MAMVTIAMVTRAAATMATVTTRVVVVTMMTMTMMTVPSLRAPGQPLHGRWPATLKANHLEGSTLHFIEQIQTVIP